MYIYNWNYNDVFTGFSIDLQFAEIKYCCSVHPDNHKSHVIHAES